MITLEKELCNCKIVDKKINTDKKEIDDKKVLCEKLCINILNGLLEGYNELKEKNPEKETDFQQKIEELKKQIQERNFIMLAKPHN